MMYLEFSATFDPYIALIVMALEGNGLGTRTMSAYWLTPEEYKLGQKILGSSMMEEFEGIEFAPDALQDEYMDLEEEVM